MTPGALAMALAPTEDDVLDLIGVLTLGQDPEPDDCSDPATRVDRITFSSGGNGFEADIHMVDGDVVMCVTVEQSGDVVFDRVVRAPGDALQIDPDAPAGDEAGSPCTEEVAAGGSQNANGYVRSGPDEGAPQHLCAGIRAAGQEHHVRVTIF